MRPLTCMDSTHGKAHSHLYSFTYASPETFQKNPIYTIVQC